MNDIIFTPLPEFRGTNVVVKLKAHKLTGFPGFDHDKHAVIELSWGDTPTDTFSALLLDDLICQLKIARDYLECNHKKDSNGFFTTERLEEPK